MTAPHGTQPEGFIGVSGLHAMQQMTEDDVRRRLRLPIEGAVGDARSKFLEGLRVSVFAPLAAIFRGERPSGFGDVADAFQDGQEALRNRIDLLDGVRGYCQAYMSKNVNGAWGVDNTRQLPFDVPLGPSRGAHVDAEKGGIVIEEQGLWTISVMATARWTAYTSSWLDTDTVRLTMRVHRPNGSVYSEKELQYLAGKSAVTPTLSVPVVIDKPGYYVTVEAYSSRWRWWDGGTRFSSLAVVKHDHRAINAGSETVKDEVR
ncbi:MULTISPECIES: hypothetical protein [Corynebacterium]|uniref:hypothetical protein n=1 Tax=Corynebacterium TaxID=1716 RepID=UPI00124C3E1E|nr:MULTISPECIES: hypothetical protein [Corynebacterium]